MDSRKNLYRIGVTLILISFIPVLIYFYCYPIYSDNYIDEMIIKNYDEVTDDLTLFLKLNDNSLNLKCGYKEDGKIKFIKAIDNHCEIVAKGENLKDIYFKKGIFTNKIPLWSLAVYVKAPEKVYITRGEKKSLDIISKFIGEKSDIILNTDDDIIDISNNVILGKKLGTALVNVSIGNKKYDSFSVVVTDLINGRSKEINNDKPYLPCHKYDLKESLALDDILKNRIDSVGYKTRAGVVEAARFLALDFKYKIDYFFENGRLSGGQNYVDGEGRYYHKGLYLHDSKFKSIDKTYSGPAIWGCPLMNFENYGTKYVSGTTNSNGLDCSGFVAWAFYNGGFDIGDKGSGDNEIDDTEINDIGGEKVKITDQLFETNKVKAGDMIGYWGHIGLIVGIDDKNIYVAETLWTFGGVVVNKYAKDKVDDEFTQVILLDDYYKDDGLYTSMWY